MILLPPAPIIHPWSLESLGPKLASLGATAFSATASATWPASSLAIYIPFYLSRSVLPVGVTAVNGATANGSRDLGIYTEDGRRINSAGLVAQSGTNQMQGYVWTGGRIGPGVFYFALSHTNTVGTYFRGNIITASLSACGVAQEDLSGAGTPGTLPATATFAAVANAFLPMVALQIKSLA